MITVTAMKWAPPFAAGQVRDHRVRWMLNEVGWPYEVRLAMLEGARAGRDWFVGDAFTVADLMLASILKVADRLALLGELPGLAAWQRGILARPAHVRAEQDQKAEIARHTPTDMRYDALADAAP